MSLKKGVERTHYKYSWARLQKEICEILNRALHAQSKDSWNLCVCIHIQTFLIIQEGKPGNFW